MSRWWLWATVHRPHVHSDGRVWLDDLFPDCREDDLAVWANEIVVALLNVWADDLNMKKSLLDKLFHPL